MGRAVAAILSLPVLARLLLLLEGVLVGEDVAAAAGDLTGDGMR